MRDDGGGSGWGGGGGWSGGGGFRGPVGWFGGGMNAIWAILALNCIVFFSTQDQFIPESALTLENLLQGKVHLLLTHQFVHGGFSHIFFNMLLLVFIGRAVLRFVTTKTFIAIYLLGGTAGALAGLLMQIIGGESYVHHLGASGAVAALLGVWTVAEPHMRLTVMFVVHCTVRQLGMFYLWLNLGMGVLDLVLVLTGGSGLGIGWMAHAFGVLYGMFHYRKFGGSLQLPKRKPRPKKTKPKKGDGRKIVAGDFGQGTEPAYNAVLDKINREGMSSLTEAEKKILSDAAENVKKQND